MQKIASFIVKYPRVIIGSTIIITLILGSFIFTNFNIQNDFSKYLDQDNKNVKLFKRIGTVFAGNSTAMIGIKVDNVFTEANINKIARLTEELKKIKGVEDVTSICNTLYIDKQPGVGLQVKDLIDGFSLPKTIAEMEVIKKRLFKSDMYEGKIISKKGDATVILCRIKENSKKDQVATIIRKTAEKFAGSDHFVYGGMPFMMNTFSEIIAKDLALLVPIALLVMIVILYYSFRTKLGVILPLATVAMSSIMSIGLMCLLGVEMTIVSAVIPVLLIAVGSAYGIHMINRYYEDLVQEKDVKKAIKKAISAVTVPIILAGATTVVGFLSLMTSGLSIVRDMGLFTAIGIIGALLISVVFVPAWLSLTKEKVATKKRNGNNSHLLIKMLDRIGLFVLKYPKLIVVSALIIVLFSIVAVPSISTEANLVEYVKKDSEIRIAEDFMKKEFGGSVVLNVHVKGNIKQPAVLKTMYKIECYLNSIKGVNNASSVADLVLELNDKMNDRYVIPETRRGVGNLWTFIDGQSVLKQLIHKDNEAVIQAMLGELTTEKISEIVKKVEHYIQANIYTEYVNVSIEDSNSKIRRYVYEEKLREFKDRIKSLLLEYKLGKKGVLEKAILLAKTTMNKRVSKAELNFVKSHLVKYLDSANAEMSLPRQTKNVLIQRVEKFLINKKTLAPKQIKTSILNSLSKVAPSLMKTEKESMQDLADTLSYKIIENINKKRIELLSNSIGGLVVTKGLRKPWLFTRDIFAASWELIKTSHSIPTKKYFALDGKNKKIKKFVSNFQVAGVPVIFKELNDEMRVSQMVTIVFAVIVVFLLMAFQFKSIVGGLIAIVPIVITVMFNFSLMSFLGVPLDNVTMIISSIIIGVGIDYSIHFISRFKVEYAVSKDEKKAFLKSLETTGQAIVFNSLSVMLGFLVLMFSQIIPFQRLGWLVAVTMFVSALAAITLLPAILILTKAQFVEGKHDRISKN